MPIRRYRNDEMREKVAQAKREWQDAQEALATVRRFNAERSANGAIWSWPTVGAALVSKHHWLIVACDSCGTMLDLDLRVKPRDPEASIRVVLKDARCARCNGHGRPRIVGLARGPSI